MELTSLLLLCLVAIYLAFFLAALQQVVTSDLEPSTKGLWVLAILVFQFFGPLAWFLAALAATAPPDLGLTTPLADAARASER